MKLGMLANIQIHDSYADWTKENKMPRTKTVPVVVKTVKHKCKKINSNWEVFNHVRKDIFSRVEQLCLLKRNKVMPGGAGKLLNYGLFSVLKVNTAQCLLTMKYCYLK